MEILEFMEVKYSSGVLFILPGVDLVGNNILLKSVNVSMYLKKLFSLLNALGDKLSDKFNPG